MAHTAVVLALALQPGRLPDPAPSAALWVTFGEALEACETDPAAVAETRESRVPDLLPSPEPPNFPEGDVRVHEEDAPPDVLVVRLHPTPEPEPGVTSTSYWMNVRAAIQSAVYWPDALRGSTAVVLRLQATPFGCVVLDPPPGEAASDAVRAAARRASERVCRAPDENIAPQARLAIRFETKPTTRRPR